MKKIIAIVGFFGLFTAQAMTSSAGYFNPAPIARCETQITKTLQRGSENNDVYVLQTMLVNAGFLNAAPNGYFGYQTQSAVRAFQYANAIPATGIVGPATRDAINERLCDTDLVDNTYSSYNMYGNYGTYSSGVTYVGQNDPFVQVISPTVTTPTVYATPQNFSQPTIATNSVYNVSPVVQPSTSVTSAVAVPSVTAFPYTTSQIASTGIVYNPSTGYTYGVVPQSGSITVTSPVANSIYNEGDTVNLNWSTNNLRTSTYSIILESTITGQSKVVAVVGGTSYSFVLTKELLDAVCVGTCNNNQQGSFKIVVALPTTDIAGTTSTLRAAIAPITVRRPLQASQVSIGTSKTPVNTGEIFKLYINIPTGAAWNSTSASNYSIKIRATCNPNVSVSVAGTPCGQDFTIPFAPVSFQQEIPAVITNPTWYKQDVTFQLTVTNLAGQVIGVGQTTVTANGASFSW